MNLPSSASEKHGKPKTLVCYICGRQFGTKSLPIHLKSCKQKFKIQQQKKTEKMLRIKLPQQPEFLKNILALIQEGSFDQEKVQKYNRQALQLFKYKILPACKYCGRTFNQQSLLIHLKACSKKNNSNIVQKEYGQRNQQQIKKPRTLVQGCVCGRQFGLVSLKIHYGQCKQKFKNAQKQKPYKERNPVPQFTQEQQEMINTKTDWSIEQISEFNQRSTQNYRNKALSQCQNCKRKFLPQSLKRHIKNCKLINGEKNSQSSSKLPTKQYPSLQKITKPKVLMCHICGRQFGLTSLKIHQRTCIQKFNNQELKRPKKQRRQLPQINLDQVQFDLNKVQTWTVQTIQRYNQFANQVYKGCSMFSCKYCGRKFLQQSLLRHINYCQKNFEEKQAKQEGKSIFTQKKTTSSFLRKNKKQTQSSVQNVKLQQEDENYKLKQKQVIQKQAKNCSKLQQNQETKLSESDLIGRKASNNLIHTIKQQKEQLEFSLKQNSQRIQDRNQQIQHNNNEFEQNQNQQDLVRTACSKCGRKFAQDRIGKHESICKGGNKKIINQETQIKKSIVKSSNQNNVGKHKIKTISPKKIAQSKSFQADKCNQEISTEKDHQINNLTPELKQCSKCGKKFMPFKLQKHMLNCKDVIYRIKIKQNPKPQLLVQNSLQQNKQVHNNQILQQKKDEKVTKRMADQLKQQIQFPIQKKPQQSNLVPCKYCRRKFNSDRVSKHQNVCNNKKTYQQTSTQINQVNLDRQLKQSKIPVITNNLDFGQQNQSNDNQFLDIQLESCAKCKRKFAPDRIEKHENVCKGPSLSFIKKQSQISKKQNIIATSKEQTCHIDKKINQEGPSKSPKPDKKNLFNIKQTIKKQSIKNHTVTVDKKQGKSLIKQNLRIANDLINGIWQTKQSANLVSKQNLKQINRITNTTAAEGGFYQQNLSYKSEQDLNFQKFEQNQNITRVSCSKCGRKFTQDRIQKHMSVCKGMQKQQQPNNAIYNNIQKRRQSNNKVSRQDKITQSVQFQSSKNVLRQFKEIKHLKINQSVIDQQIEKQLNGIKIKPINQIKSIGFSARNTYGQGQKFYTRKQQVNIDAKSQNFSNNTNVNRKVPRNTQVEKASYNYSPKVAIAKKWKNQLPQIQ